MKTFKFIHILENFKKAFTYFFYCISFLLLCNKLSQTQLVARNSIYLFHNFHRLGSRHWLARSFANDLTWIMDVLSRAGLPFETSGLLPNSFRLLAKLKVLMVVGLRSLFCFTGCGLGVTLSFQGLPSCPSSHWSHLWSTTIVTIGVTVQSCSQVPPTLKDGHYIEGIIQGVYRVEVLGAILEFCLPKLF